MNAFVKAPLAGLDGNSRPVIVPIGQEVIWQALRAMKPGNVFSCRDIARALGCSLSAIENYVLMLVRAGHVSETGRGPNAEKLYHLHGRPHLMPGLNSKGGTDATYALSDEIWRAVKMLRLFTFSELVIHLDRETSKAAVRVYLTALEEAGYLIGLEAVRECGEKQYKLVPAMSSGPLPPQMMRATFMWDRNRHRVANRQLVAAEVRL